MSESDVVDVRVISRILYDLHKHATTTMGELEAKGGPISKLPLPVRRYLAQQCTQIVGEHLYKGCPVLRPAEFKGCDLNITIVNLYQVMSLAIQYDDTEDTSRVFDIIASLRDMNVKSSRLTGISVDLELFAREQNLTLSQVSAIIGPVMFTAYRKAIPQDYMVQYFEETCAERRAIGYTGDMDPIRRIQFIAVVLDNGGTMNSNVMRQCLAVAMVPDFRNIDHVKAFTKQEDATLYARIKGDLKGKPEEEHEVWLYQQKRLLEAEEKVLSETKEEATPPGEDDERGFCLVCGRESTARCSACKNVYYCSRKCQKSNWKAHKRGCVAPAPKKE